MLEICESISQFNLPWSALSRVDTIDDEIVSALHRSGCIELKFGLESGSNLMLKKMNKGFNVQQAQNAIDICARYGIRVKLFLIHGFPGENMETTQETIEFLEKNAHIINRVSMFRWTPLPGSYVYNNAAMYGLDPKMLEFDNAVIYSKESNWFADPSINKEVDEAYVVLKNRIEKMNFTGN